MPLDRQRRAFRPHHDLRGGALSEARRAASSAEVAARIVEARGSGALLEAPLPEVTDLADAYAVQADVVAHRLRAGQVPVGWKLGYTSAAMRRQMGVEDPNHAPLTDAMVMVSGATVPEQGLLHPRVEPEVVVVVGEVEASSRRDPAAVVASVRRAHAALEVVDSVFAGYRFRIEDNTADGSSAAYAVLGPELDLAAIDQVGVTLMRNGEPVGHGVGADAMGGPLAALRWLVTALDAQDREVRPGDLVLTGGLTAAVPLEAGDEVAATFDDVRVAVRRGDRR